MLGLSRNGIRDENFLSLFLGLSQPRLDRNIAGMMFLNFFAIFFGIFSLRPGKNGVQDEIFFSLSRPILPDLDRNIARMIFLDFFSIFLGIF